MKSLIMNRIILVSALLFTGLLLSFSRRDTAYEPSKTGRLVLGIERTSEYVPLLKGKRVGLVVNHSTIFPSGGHLVDSLLKWGIDVKTIFAPEHGFRGTADAGAVIKNGKDEKTGVAIISLYGKNKKPTVEQVRDLDVLLFDIQDVGVRYFTYPSTMHYVMEACAENGKSCIVLDRPNPNGHYIDGPVLDRKFASFVGMNPVPIVHALTSGELALMINGEGWLEGKKPCDLTVVPCLGYTHQTRYELPVPPSPNMPNLQAIQLYPSICLFEPTIVSVGRGTTTQFQVIGAPDQVYGKYTFTPVSRPGAQEPLNKGQVCYGYDLRKVNTLKERFTLKYVIDFYNKAPDKSKFFTSASFFDKLAGTDQVRKMIEDGKSESEIRKTYEPELAKYKESRKKYLLYPD
jgi:uncharacterized protein YbbC (DUF1343 family)